MGLWNGNTAKTHQRKSLKIRIHNKTNKNIDYLYVIED